MAAMAGTIRRTVPRNSAAMVRGLTPSRKPLRSAARKTAVPVEETGTISTSAVSKSFLGSGVACPVTASPLAIFW